MVAGSPRAVSVHKLEVYVPLFSCSESWTSKTLEDFQVQLTCSNVAQMARRRKKASSLNVKIAKHDNVCVWCAARWRSSLGRLKCQWLTAYSSATASSTRCWTYNSCSNVPNALRNKMLMAAWVVLVKIIVKKTRGRTAESYPTENQRPCSNASSCNPFGSRQWALNCHC